MQAPFLLYATTNEYAQIKELINNLTGYAFAPRALKNTSNITELVLRATVPDNQVDFKLLSILIYLQEQGAITFSYTVTENNVKYDILTINHKILQDIHAKPRQEIKPNENSLTSEMRAERIMLRSKLEFNPYQLEKKLIGHPQGTFTATNIQQNNTANLPINDEIVKHCKSVSIRKVRSYEEQELLQRYCTLFDVKPQTIAKNLYQQFCFTLYKYQTIGLLNYKTRVDVKEKFVKEESMDTDSANKQTHRGAIEVVNEIITTPKQFINQVSVEQCKKAVEAGIKLTSNYSEKFTLSQVEEMTKSHYSKLTVFGISRPLHTLSDIKMTDEFAYEKFCQIAQMFHFFARSPFFVGEMTASSAERLLEAEYQQNKAFHYLIRSSSTSLETLTMSYILPISGEVYHARFPVKFTNPNSEYHYDWKLVSSCGDEMTVTYPETFEQKLLEGNIFYDNLIVANSRQTECPEQEFKKATIEKFEKIFLLHEISEQIHVLVQRWLSDNENDNVSTTKKHSLESENEDEDVFQGFVKKSQRTGPGMFDNTEVAEFAEDSHSNMDVEISSQTNTETAIPQNHTPSC